MPEVFLTPPVPGLPYIAHEMAGAAAGAAAATTAATAAKVAANAAAQPAAAQQQPHAAPAPHVRMQARLVAARPATATVPQHTTAAAPRARRQNGMQGMPALQAAAATLEREARARE